MTRYLRIARSLACSVSLLGYPLLLTTGCADQKTTSFPKAVQQLPDDRIMLSDNQMLLANVAVGKVGQRKLGETITLNGTLRPDKERSKTISSRAAGRLEKLFVKETGVAVKKGMPLYTLYSESMLTMQQEYLLAKDQAQAIPSSRYTSLLEAAERKLLLYGLTGAQIKSLGRNDLKSSVTFLSPADGIVTALSVQEGSYVSEGSAMYQLEEIGALWVEAELYPNETPFVKIGDEISVHVSGDNQPLTSARVTFLSPELKSNSQIVVLRAPFRNSDYRYKSGQQVQVLLMHSARETIAVPVDAVIRLENGAHVYVKDGHNTFKPRVVSTGIESADQIEITHGLLETDTLAVSGAYLLYSELVLRRGIDPAMAHQH